MMLSQQHLDELLARSKPDHMEVVGKSTDPYSDVNVTCTICLTPYYCKDAEGNHETPVIMPCGHIFGEQCFAKWNKHSMGDLTCPMCRFGLQFKICGHTIKPLPVFPKPSIIKDKDIADFCIGCARRQLPASWQRKWLDMLDEMYNFPKPILDILRSWQDLPHPLTSLDPDLWTLEIPRRFMLPIEEGTPQDWDREVAITDPKMQELISVIAAHAETQAKEQAETMARRAAGIRGDSDDGQYDMDDDDDDDDDLDDTPENEQTRSERRHIRRRTRMQITAASRLATARRLAGYVGYANTMQGSARENLLPGTGALWNRDEHAHQFASMWERQTEMASRFRDHTTRNADLGDSSGVPMAIPGPTRFNFSDRQPVPAWQLHHHAVAYGPPLGSTPEQAREVQHEAETASQVSFPGYDALGYEPRISPWDAKAGEDFDIYWRVRTYNLRAVYFLKIARATLPLIANARAGTNAQPWRTAFRASEVEEFDDDEEVQDDSGSDENQALQDGEENLIDLGENLPEFHFPRV